MHTWSENLESISYIAMEKMITLINIILVIAASCYDNRSEKIAGGGTTGTEYG